MGNLIDYKRFYSGVWWSIFKSESNQLMRSTTFHRILNTFKCHQGCIVFIYRKWNEWSNFETDWTDCAAITNAKNSVSPLCSTVSVPRHCPSNFRFTDSSQSQHYLITHEMGTENAPKEWMRKQKRWRMLSTSKRKNLFLDEEMYCKEIRRFPFYNMYAFHIVIIPISTRQSSPPCGNTWKPRLLYHSCLHQANRGHFIYSSQKQNL